jgi:hypothetical protein
VLKKKPSEISDGFSKNIEMDSLQKPCRGHDTAEIRGTSALPDGGCHSCYITLLAWFKFIAVWARGGRTMYAAIRQGSEALEGLIHAPRKRWKGRRGSIAVHLGKATRLSYDRRTG